MRRYLSLSGTWRYTPLARVTIGADGTWRPDTSSLPTGGQMRLPTHWERAGLPGFAGTVRFEQHFTPSQLKDGEALWLVCRGGDYTAAVHLNQRPVGTHEGYFQTWDLDLTPNLQPGENLLAIDVTCPQEEPGAVWPNNKRTIKGILSHWDCRSGSWDPATGQDAHSGDIWNDVLLEVRPAVSIARTEVQPWLTSPNEALAQHFLAHNAAIAQERVARVLVATTLAGVVAEDSSRYVRPTSEFNEHFYYGWYGGHVASYLAPPSASIITEFGAQALPSVAEMQQMVGAAWPPDWRAMAYHDFQYDQTFNVARIPLGGSWEEFVAASQQYQADLLKIAIERFRRARYAPVGGLFQFMFMDCWPSVTWSVLSYERRPKAGYTALQTAYQPVLVGALLERDTWLTYTDLGSHSRPPSVVAWIVNDLARSWTGAQLTFFLRDEAGGKEAEIGRLTCSVPADDVLTLPRTVLAIPGDWTDGEYTLHLRLESGDEILSSNQYRIHLITQNPALAGDVATTAPASQPVVMTFDAR